MARWLAFSCLITDDVASSRVRTPTAWRRSTLCGVLLGACVALGTENAKANHILADGLYSAAMPDSTAANNYGYVYVWTADAAGTVTVTVSPVLNCTNSSPEGAAGYSRAC